MGGRAKLVAIVVALAGGASCAQIIGLEPFGSGGAGGGGGAGGQPTVSASSSGGAGVGAAGGATSVTSSASGGSACTDGATCVAPPAGWLGPVVLATGTSSCGALPLELTATEPLSDLTCPMCSCQPSGCSVDIDIDTAGAMDCSITTTVSAVPGCANFTAGSAAAIKVTPKQIGAGTCGRVGTCQPPTPEPIALCVPGAQCGAGGRCLPPDTRLCVYSRNGDACPTGFKPDGGVVAYEIYQVSPCGCAPPTHIDCSEPTVALYGLSGCGGMSSGAIPTGSCVPISAKKSLLYAPTDPGTCGEPKSKETTSQQILVCCQ